jgi:hypothetical protein
MNGCRTEIGNILTGLIGTVSIVLSYKSNSCFDLKCYVILLKVMLLSSIFMRIRSFPFGKCLFIFTFSTVPLTSVEVGVACSTGARRTGCDYCGEEFAS